MTSEDRQPAWERVGRSAVYHVAVREVESLHREFMTFNGDLQAGDDVTADDIEQLQAQIDQLEMFVDEFVVPVVENSADEHSN